VRGDLLKALPGDAAARLPLLVAAQAHAEFVGDDGLRLRAAERPQTRGDLALTFFLHCHLEGEATGRSR
jgi:hypothetical protein